METSWGKKKGHERFGPCRVLRWQLSPVSIGVTGWEGAGAHLALESSVWGFVAGWMVRKKPWILLELSLGGRTCC